jgi:glycosyltransferase involved in cell wall biosynthesis
VSGYVVDDVAAAVDAVPQALALDRRACRAAFEARFGAATMVGNYLNVYDQLIAAHETI